MVTLSRTVTDAVRAKVSKRKVRLRDGTYDLDLTYVTPRTIAMGYPTPPSSRLESTYRNRLADVRAFLDSRHGSKYKIYNLCTERSYDDSSFHGRTVVRYPFDDHSCPPFRLVRDAVADIDAWLRIDDDNVAAVHCKAGKGRTGLVLAAYLLHAGLCATAADALGHFGNVRTHDGRGVTIPSQRRYVGYYERYLRMVGEPSSWVHERGPLPESRKRRLVQIRVMGGRTRGSGIPKFDGVAITCPDDGDGCGGARWTSASWGAGWKEKDKFVETTTSDCGGSSLSPRPRRRGCIVIPPEPVWLAKDVHIVFTRRKVGVAKRVVFGFWFHAQFLDDDDDDREGNENGNGDDGGSGSGSGSGSVLRLSRMDIDGACRKKTGSDFTVEVCFE